MNKSSLEFFKSLLDRDKAVLDMLVESTGPSLEKQYDKPYSNIKFVNDVLTVILNDGSIISKHPATIDHFNLARGAEWEEELFAICSSSEGLQEKRKIEEEVRRNAALAEGVKTLLDHCDDEFEERDGALYMIGIDRSMPQLLIEEFIMLIDAPMTNENAERWEGLKRFWMWCCLNPRAEVADELFRFLKDNSFRITKQGFFVALRNVVTLHGGAELVHFVSNSYNKVKAVWKKSPDKYEVFLQNGDYKLVHEDDLFEEETLTTTTCPECLGEGGWEGDDWNEENDSYEWVECPNCEGAGDVDEYTETRTWSINHGQNIGNLTQLYLDLPNRAENRFTDDWTKTFDIRVGVPVKMPMEECNWSTQDCAAAGLHFTADQIHYVGCGDQSMLVLINPMKVVGIGQHKGRCYEYLPIMTVPRNEATSILHDLDFDTMQLDDSYAIQELDNLAEKVKEGFAAEAKKYNFNFPTINPQTVENIISSLEDMKQVIDGRVVIV
jgi:hypothetical protein